jgi:hypothetical protein
MPRIGFEPMVLVFGRQNTVCTLHHAGMCSMLTNSFTLKYRKKSRIAQVVVQICRNVAVRGYLSLFRVRGGTCSNRGPGTGLLSSAFSSLPQSALVNADTAP